MFGSYYVNCEDVWSFKMIHAKQLKTERAQSSRVSILTASLTYLILPCCSLLTAYALVSSLHSLTVLRGIIIL